MRRQKHQNALNEQLHAELNKIAKDDEEEPNWSRVRGLIICGTDPNTVTPKNQHEDGKLFGLTALHFAVLHRNIPMVRFLLQHRANQFEQDNDHVSPFSLTEKMDDSDPNKAELVDLLTYGAHNKNRR